MIKKWLVIIMALLMVTVVYVEAAEQSVVMDIEGMTCPLCPIAVKKSLSGVDGVKEVEVSLEEKKAWLTVEESVTDETFVDAVKKAGSFKGKVVERKTKE
jgi:mercuric ion binding protein